MATGSGNGTPLATVFGGSGFIGRYVVRALARRGFRVRAAVRRPELAGHLQPMGDVGQIHAVQANLRYADSVARALEGASVAVNLVGILHETGRQSFEAIHAVGAGVVAEAARQAGAGAVVQISAIGADAGSPSKYARSKAAGEAAVRADFPGAVIMRPSVVFGSEDEFFNRFAALARLAPALPLIGGGNTRFQPVYVGDVAEAVARAVEGGAAAGDAYELGGPDIMTLRQVFEFVLEVTERRRLLIPLSFILARMQAAILQQLPRPLLTVDQVRLLEHDNVVSEAARDAGRTLEGLGIAPRTVRAIAPEYLERFRKTGQFRSTST